MIASVSKKKESRRRKLQCLYPLLSTFLAEYDNKYLLVELFHSAAVHGKLEILKWVQEAAYELRKILSAGTITEVAQKVGTSRCD